eukprot:CAMPEP_0182509006 /NCGR_PEP_ID=MMETSP1321-20130603/26054_1 /TAXON_ID=91990 /ORGANISM="Bolidomonas sp., Strain RCC1657" /LENGTH=42 /DNA_ID= /DNA_START= /DNA_END= /DNA_ORIENTATION=
MRVFSSVKVSTESPNFVGYQISDKWEPVGSYDPPSQVPPSDI